MAVGAGVVEANDDASQPHQGRRDVRLMELRVDQDKVNTMTELIEKMARCLSDEWHEKMAVWDMSCSKLLHKRPDFEKERHIFEAQARAILAMFKRERVKLRARPMKPHHIHERAEWDAAPWVPGE